MDGRGAIGRQTMGVSAGARRARVDIEVLLVWVYQRQQAHKVARVGLDRPGWGDVSGDGCARVAQIAALGCSVDGGGYRSGALAEDAEIVHGEVMRLDDLSAGLVVAHGMTASRPDWMPGAVPSLGPKIERGRVLVIRGRQREHGFCPLQWKLSVDTIELRRGQYAVWRQALERLARVLDARLVDHAVLPPRAPVAPWLDFSQGA